MSSAFADRLAAALEKSGTPLCMGIDPHPALLPAFLSGQEPARAIRLFGQLAIEAAASASLPAVKPQVALFEQHGPAGMAVLAELAELAQQAGLLVIMDAKRGDIGSTSAAYAAAWLGPHAPFAADALTVNPFMGMDTLAPFIEAAASTGRGLFVLVRTSNEGSGDLQDLDAGGKPVWQRLADQLARLDTGLAASLSGLSGWSGLGVVVGATRPQQAEALRSILPNAPFLIPGYGAQGAGPERARAGLLWQETHWQGGLINSARGLTGTDAARQASSPDSFQNAVLTAIRQARAELDSPRAAG
jgi:orotidine-5'-phosphate decarboxylase